MRAAIFKNYGAPEDVIEFVDIPKPVPKDDEILIKVHYTSVNRTDCGFRRGSPFFARAYSGLVKPRKAFRIQGNEFSGIIEEVGKDVKDFKIGDKVFGFDDVKWGGHAEYKTIKQTAMVAKIPKNFDLKTSAVMLEGAHYALAYIKATDISKESKVMVYGASGAIGSAAVQIVKHIGANITAVCGTKNVKLVKELGIDKAIDYQTDDFTVIKDKFDVVFDAVGKSSYKVCKPLLKDGGIYTSTELGNNGQNPLLAISTKFYGKKRVMFPLPKNSKKDVLYLKELAEQGAYKPIIDKEYKFKDLVEATEYVESGQKTGNIVIKVI